jgi:chromosome segregation ATPase
MGVFESKETLQRIKNIEKRTEKTVELYNSLILQINNFKLLISEAEKRSPDYEKEAKQASRKASEFKNKASVTLNQINEVFNASKVIQLTISKLSSELSDSIQSVKSEYEELLESNETIEIKREEIFTKISSIETKIDLVEETFENHPELSVELQNLEEFLTKVEDIHNKSNLLLKTITTRKNEIDRLHNEIIGFTEVNDETDEETHINGLKDDLEQAYNGLNDKLENLKVKIDNLEKESKLNYEVFHKESNDINLKMFEDWTEKYTNLNKKIDNLLPNALTAGLSYAFSDKKNEEVKSYDNHKKQFSNGIKGMIAVSLIPFTISVCFIINEIDINTVIDRVPRLVLAILPLYIPVLWLSISSSKKMNLSKRLIEEYSHKEVLSKTFEGLSNQIEGLGEENISSNLKITLLQNFLQVYSENPGKLISNYDTSDHPIMELLENTNRLENSIEKLNKIPGMEKLVNLLEKKAKEKLTQTTGKIEKGLDKVLALNENEGENEVEK